MISKYYIDCVHKKMVASSTSTGRTTKTYTDNNIKGYLGQQLDNTKIVADKVAIDTKFKFFSSTYDFKNGDLIVYNSKTYEVCGEPKNTAHKTHHCKIYVKKIEGVT